MITKTVLRNLFDGEYSKEDIVDYFRGMYRYKLYYSKCKFLIRPHIIEQINFRIKVMDKECLNQGTCKLCGCMVTALQMANKMCEKPCYPPMLNKKDWKEFRRTGQLETKIPLHTLIWKYRDNKLICYIKRGNKNG